MWIVILLWPVLYPFVVWWILDLYMLLCKVKCTLVQALRLCTVRMAHRGSRGIALPSHDHGTRRGWEVSVMPWPLFTPGKDPVPIVQEAGWAPGPIWTSAEKIDPTGIRSPDRPARSQLLYRLRYQACYCVNINVNVNLCFFCFAYLMPVLFYYCWFHSI